jgi:hypothetical protein
MAKDHPNDIGIGDVLKILGGIAAVILVLGIGCWGVISAVGSAIDQELNNVDPRQGDQASDENDLSEAQLDAEIEDLIGDLEKVMAEAILLEIVEKAAVEDVLIVDGQPGTTREYPLKIYIIRIEEEEVFRCETLRAKADGEGSYQYEGFTGSGSFNGYEEISQNTIQRWHNNGQIVDWGRPSEGIEFTF